MIERDPYLDAAIDEARRGLAEGGIPIGSVVVHRGMIIGRGHNRRVQTGSPVLHGEMDALHTRDGEVEEWDLGGAAGGPAVVATVVRDLRGGVAWRWAKVTVAP